MSLLIDAKAVFIVQTRPKANPGYGWEDTQRFCEEAEGEAFDQADYLREDGDTEARVVRRWS